MSSESAIEYCEHDEMRAACLECLAMPKKVAPQAQAAPRATKTPTSENDKISPLGGDLDMSMAADLVEPLVGAEWLAVRTFPHYLRRAGWIYLRAEGRLQARVKVSKVVWRAERKVPSDGPYVDLGPGLALLVDARTWEGGIDIDLGRHATSQEHGYRYLMTNEDGSVTHYSGGRPIPEHEELFDDED
ncbi:MAG: hypothetical protein AAF467_17055 [Actinomycetota bacterium]